MKLRYFHFKTFPTNYEFFLLFFFFFLKIRLKLNVITIIPPTFFQTKLSSTLHASLRLHIFRFIATKCIFNIQVP